MDSENIDPSTFSTSNKSASVKTDSTKMNSFKTFTTVFSKGNNPLFTSGPLAPVAGLKRKASTLDHDVRSTVRLDRPVKALRTSPKPSTAPAGRSPVKSKGSGILSRRRVSAHPFTRIDPPSFGGSKSGLPSIEAALSGTLSNFKPQSKVVTTLPDTDVAPKRWSFAIHEDTPEQESSNLMEHSTSTLDISDDETRAARKDDRGKENIPPVDGLNAPARSVSRSDIMSDDTRAPLADLNAGDFYAPGCDASSVFVEAAEGSIDSDKEKSNVYDNAEFRTPDSAKVEGAAAA